jgi:hypothetical protein
MITPILIFPKLLMMGAMVWQNPVATSAGQTKPGASAKLAVKAPVWPSLPAGISAEQYQTFSDIHAQLQKGQFAAAGRLLTLLPDPEVTFAWDDSAAPIYARDGYADARDMAFRTWEKVSPRPSFSERTAGKAPVGIQFRFAPTLGNDPVTNTPRAAAFLFRADGNPRLECIIATKRGPKGSPTTGIEVRNEVAYAVAMYHGLTASPIFGTISSRTDLNVVNATGITVAEAENYRRIQEYSNALHGAVLRKQRWSLQQAHLFVDPTVGVARETEESQIAQFTFQLSNTGTGPMSYRTIGDCGCVIPAPPGVVAPGQTVVIRPRIDTTGFADLMDKRLLLYTNDPEMPLKMLPLRVRVVPRFVWKDPNNGTLVMQDDQIETKLTVSYANTRLLDWSRAQIDGTLGTVTATPTTVGNRTQVAVNLNLKAPPLAGRTLVSLTVPVIDAERSLARYTFSVQKGIAMFPSDLYLGTLAGEPKVVSVQLSRPGKPFIIKRVLSDLPYLKFSVTDLGKQDEYRVTVSYAGGAPSGEILGTLSIETNDPKQPIIKMAITGARV